MRYNKVRGIVRAKQGSQIPKFWNGGYTPNLPQFLGPNFSWNFDKRMQLGLSQLLQGTTYNPNPNMTGSTTPLPKTATASGTKLNMNSLGNAIGQGSDLISGMFSADKDGYLGKYGQLQQMGDQAFDLASNAVMQINPLVGGIMKAGGLVSDLLTTYGGMGTDSMTKTDAILGSKLLSLTPVGMVNGFFGKRTQDFGINQQTLEQVGSSYGGSKNTILDADSKAKKKYGLLSSGSRRKANNLITEAKRQQNIMTDIANDARDMQVMSGNDLNYINYNFDINGGYDLRYMRAAKSGMKIQDKIDFVKNEINIKSFINLDTKEIEWEPVIELFGEWEPIIEFKEGGSLPELWEPIIELFEEWEPEIILEVEEFQKGGKTRTLEELIEYAKKENPRFIQRLSEEPRGIKFTDDGGNEGEGSHYLEWSTDDFGNAIIYPRIQEIEDGSLKFFPSDEAYQRAVKTKNILTMSPEEANTFFSEDPEYKTAYKRGWPSFFKLFKDGGKTKEELETPEIEETNQKNLIPEGALHKNKHHMEHTEGLTLKGIPVIDNEGEQLAEIELDEIIFTLEVTKKLEELYKEGTDEAAIEAGKLLVKEILFNTDDRTGLISKCLEGGKICQTEE